jgi:hypothetical protein
MSHRRDLFGHVALGIYVAQTECNVSAGMRQPSEIARPKPRAAPVTSATWPVSSKFGNDIETLAFPERIFQRARLRREQLRAAFSNAHIVLNPYAKLTANIDARLIARCHIGLQFGRVAAHKVRPLVSIHS